MFDIHDRVAAVGYIAFRPFVTLDFNATSSRRKITTGGSSAESEIVHTIWYHIDGQEEPFSDYEFVTGFIESDTEPESETINGVIESFFGVMRRVIIDAVVKETEVTVDEQGKRITTKLDLDIFRFPPDFMLNHGRIRR
ncbi:hypothetical protein KW782_01800 [Candidatus Parcubacteria bacterium]|nr:hypothetical protein [Candidatus Parcubacteria bacterium]